MIECTTYFVLNGTRGRAKTFCDHGIALAAKSCGHEDRPTAFGQLVQGGRNETGVIPRHEHFFDARTVVRNLQKGIDLGQWQPARLPPGLIDREVVSDAPEVGRWCCNGIARAPVEA